MESDSTHIYIPSLSVMPQSIANQDTDVEYYLNGDASRDPKVLIIHQRHLNRKPLTVLGSFTDAPVKTPTWA